MELASILPGAARRVLRFLAKGPASLRPAALDGAVLIEADGRGAISVDGKVLDLLASRGVLVRASHSVALSDNGALLAQRLGSPADAARHGCRDVGLMTVGSDAAADVVLANLSESPLAQLARRRTRTGTSFLTKTEYNAGERLREDYTRGRIMPRLGANWEASVSSGRRAGGGAIELTYAALAARRRVEDAIAAVGPELSGVLIDICCFLKGLELVETERGWPVRSAKVVLKTALGVLARHYFPAENIARRRNRMPLHWGTDDYRPRIDG